MKRLIKIIILASMLPMVAGCEKQNNGFPPSSDLLLCSLAFKETYLRNFQKDDIFFIKGVALDISGHGRNIRVIKDLKGNFRGRSTIFVWGNGFSNNPASICAYGRQDNITRYRENDTLLMFVERTPCRDFEPAGDYATLVGKRSVVRLSNGYVIGEINSWDGEEKVLWEELQEKMQAFLNLEEKPCWWLNKFCVPRAFSFAYEQSRSIDFTYFVKGLVLESQNEYGKRMEIISDLKGNFPDGITHFTVWGCPHPADHFTSRFDNLRLYNDQDTLLMLLGRINRDIRSPRSNVDERFPDIDERQGDFETFPLAFSVLKLSNNTVSGYITSVFGKKQTMLWEEFQELLSSIGEGKP